MARRPPPFRSILVPLDGSPFGEAALPWATALAAASRAKLRLVLVHRSPPPVWSDEAARLFTRVELAMRRSERDYLRRHAAHVRRVSRIQVATAVLDGPVARTLLEYVTDCGAALVVMGTHGRGPLQRAWLGSMADEMLRALQIPFLLVRPVEGGPAVPAMFADGELLVPLDGSGLAEAVLPPAAGIARVFDAPVTLLQVVPPVVLATDPALPFPQGFDEELTAAARDDAQDYLDGVAERLREEGVRATAVAALGGNPAETVLDASKAAAVRMVALATHGRGGVRRLVLGSVADKLIRGAEQPVLVVRPTGKARRS